MKLSVPTWKAYSTRWRNAAGVLALALVYTLVNVPKPLLVDDTAYYYFAEQMAKDAWNPYGFDVFWYEQVEPANHVLAPPVMLSWWALAIRLFGMQPMLWKLWLFPFSLLFVGTLHALARRFARGLEWPLVTMTVLSPAFLPSLNLMLDVPALSLSLGAVALFLRAAERGSLSLALLSGLLAGLAMQTKYTSFVAPAILIAAGWQARRLRLGLAAAGLAVVLFAGWEWVIAWKYGESHFLYASRFGQSDVPPGFAAFLARNPTESALLRKGYSLLFALLHKALLFWPLLSVFGAVAPGVLVLQVVGWRASPRCRHAVVAVVVSGFLLVAMVPERFQLLFHHAGSGAWLNLDGLLFGTLGVASFALTARTLWRLRSRKALPATHTSRPFSARRKAAFLTTWFFLELAAYFALTPFPAVRRVFGLLVIVTLLTGRLVVLTCREPERRPLLRLAVGLSLSLGLLYATVDLVGANAHQQAAEEAARLAEARPAGATVWFVGHWGFQYYAERAGMRPAVPGESRLQPGDWLVIPDPSHVNTQRLAVDPMRTELVQELLLADNIPLRTVANYYGGLIPLARQEGPRVRVSLYRVTSEHVPEWLPFDP